uniref:Uncharacterized protein n=1 Tax=Opuntia streptacantha TaxID=393608 RepID=A0A7C8ZVW5_OPUST
MISMVKMHLRKEWAEAVACMIHSTSSLRSLAEAHLVVVAAEVEDKGEEKMSSILLRSHLKISIWEQQKSSPCHVMLYARGAMGKDQNLERRRSVLDARVLV